MSGVVAGHGILRWEPLGTNIGLKSPYFWHLYAARTARITNEKHACLPSKRSTIVSHRSASDILLDGVCLTDL